MNEEIDKIDEIEYWHCLSCDCTSFGFLVTQEGVLIKCRECGCPKGYITEFEPWDEGL